MSKYCIRCGASLNDEAAFCHICGAAQPAQNPYAAPRSPAGPQQQNVSYAPQQQTVTYTPPKKKSGGFVKVLAFLMAGVLLFTGFVNPGFIKEWLRQKGDPSATTAVPGSSALQTEPSGTASAPTSPGGSEEPSYPEYFGSSQPLDYSPLPGFHVTAEENAFAQDTDVTIAPVTDVPEAVLEAVSVLEEDGYLMIGGYELHAGLADDEVMPGEFTVTMDMGLLGINPGLYDSVRAFRIGDDGSFYQLAVSVEDGELTFRSDQNSFIAYAVCAAVIGTYYRILEQKEAQQSVQYFYDIKKEKFTCSGKNPFCSYQIHWAMEDINVDADDLIRRCEAIARKYADKKDELYENYSKEQGFNAKSILNIFDRGKSVAQVLREAIEADEEYQELQQKLKVPELIDFTISCVYNALDFLCDHEFVRKPTGIVELTSVTTLDDTTLAEQTARNFHEGYVEINLKELVNAPQVKRNDFLITVTHELLHVCQQKYRFFWADSNRYDEMAAVYMEPRALEYFVSKKIIAEDAQPMLSTSYYWTTLKLPIDAYYVDVNQKGEKDGSVMKHEGYNLGLFVRYLVEKRGKTVWTSELMAARSSWKQPGTSGPLMKLFGMEEEEFDIHYRTFFRVYKEQMALHYDTKEPERYKRNEEIPLVKGGKYRVDVRPEGAFSSEIRGFLQGNKEKTILLLIPDPGFKTDQPECDLIPIDRYESIPKGLYIYPKDGKGNLNRDILEIHGSMKGTSVQKSTGYTLYALAQTKQPIPSQNGESLILKMPENSYAADDGVIDGYLLKIEAENGVKIEREVPPDSFEKEVLIPRSELYGDTDASEDLTVSITLCEYIKKNEKDKLFGEESEAVSFTLTPVRNGGLERFKGWWIPIELTEPTEDDYIIGLTYEEEDGTVSYFEGQHRYAVLSHYWTTFSSYEYDEESGVLTLQFARGPATFRIGENGHLYMSNYGGTWEFYSGSDD